LRELRWWKLESSCGDSKMTQRSSSSSKLLQHSIDAKPELCKRGDVKT